MIKRPREVALLVLLVLSLSPVLAAAAPDPLKQCDRGVEANPSTRDAWGCFYRAARSGADWSDAEASLRASMTRNASALSKPSPRGYALLTLANIVAEHEPEAGLALYQDALEALTEGEDHLAQILTLLNMAHRYRSTGAPQRGAEALELASVAADALGDPKWIATVAVEAVRHDLRTQGDLGRAERRMADVESLLFPDGSLQAQLTWLNTPAPLRNGWASCTSRTIWPSDSLRSPKLKATPTFKPLANTTCSCRGGACGSMPEARRVPLLRRMFAMR